MMKKLFTVLWNIRQLDIWSPLLAIIWMSFWDLIISIPFKRYHCPKLGKYRWSYYRWYLIYGDELAQWRSSVFVLRAVPAAVVRFGRCRGSVVAVWGLLGEADPEEKDSEPPTMKPPYGGESGGKAAAVAAVSSNLYQEVNTMRNYKEAYISELIAKRAKEKAERRGGTFANEGATRGTVPFTEWLYYTEGIVRWTELSKYELWNYYLDYRVDCVRNGMMFQCGEIYGLTNV